MNIFKSHGEIKYLLLKKHFQHASPKPVKILRMQCLNEFNLVMFFFLNSLTF